MAILIVCAVRDSAVNAFSRPFFVPAVGAAVRAFGDEVSRVDSDMHKHPEDFELYELGTFDEESGVLVSCPTLRSVSRGKDHHGGSHASHVSEGGK